MIHVGAPLSNRNRCQNHERQKFVEKKNNELSKGYQFDFDSALNVLEPSLAQKSAHTLHLAEVRSQKALADFRKLVREVADKKLQVRF